MIVFKISDQFFIPTLNYIDPHRWCLFIEELMKEVEINFYERKKRTSKKNTRPVQESVTALAQFEQFAPIDHNEDIDSFKKWC